MTDTRTGTSTIVLATAIAGAAFVGFALRELSRAGAHGVAGSGPPASGAVSPSGSATPGTIRETDTATVREIRVLVACDEEVRRRSGWRERAMALVRLASTPWEREFGLRWTPVECVEWTSDDAAASMQDLRRHLMGAVPPGSADVVLGLTGQDRAFASPAVYDALGVSDYFGRVAVAGIDWPGRWGRDPNTVAHELGHLLGAWHCYESDTIMSAPSSDLTRFDSRTRALIPLVRDYDFGAGPDSLDDATVAAISALWRSGRAADARHPVADAFQMRGWKRAMGGSPETAAADLERAIEILAACGITKGAHVSSCLVGVARSYQHSSRPDRVRELEYAQRGRAAAGDEDEDPIASSWMQLGHALWSNRRNAEAIDAYAVALELRRRRLGASHTDTADARQALQWFASRGHAAASAALAREK